jgi:ABC-2 type transport system ATP-binding protein
MGQRLGIAAALLGDPEIIVLDEPINGLDPEGIRWIRTLLKALAAEGRTVFLSSHLMSEMALTADHLIIIGQGRLIRDVSLVDFVDESSANIVRVRSPEATRLRDVILGPDVRVSSDEPSVLSIDGLTAQQVGHLAAVNGVELHELTTEKTSLEDAFMELTRDDTEYRATTLASPDTIVEADRRERIAA